MRIPDMIAAITAAAARARRDSTPLAEALAWVLQVVRAARRQDLYTVAYAAGWLRCYTHHLASIHAELHDSLIRVTALATPSNEADATPEELEQLDDALCDAIERVDYTRGCGWYKKVDGKWRLVHRPPAFTDSDAA